jgi:carbon-monoxide dehydrogenase small subunit
MKLVKLDVNDTLYEIQVEGDETLLNVLREKLDLTGAKPGCNTGSCGACKVIIDGESINSCSILAYKAENKKIYTIESFARSEGLHPIQNAFIEAGAVQCGYCTPGMIINTKVLLDKNSSPTELEIRKAFSNNLCRCTGYVKIIKAVQLAAHKLGGSKSE